MAAEQSLPSNHMELFVKAGRDGESYGACPLCQRMFMILLLKAEAGSLSFTVTTVNISKPPVEFKRISSRLPTIVHGSEILTDVDEMVEYIDQHFPSPPLRVNNMQAMQVTQDVFSKFSFFIKDVSHSQQPLLTELTRIDQYMTGCGQSFLESNEPSHLDCVMLPKLQHIRVVCSALKNFAIAPDLQGLWKYLGTAYSQSFFRQTCPSDQEILHHWLNKPETHRVSLETENRLLSGNPSYTFDVPLC